MASPSSTLLACCVTLGKCLPFLNLDGLLLSHVTQRPVLVGGWGGWRSRWLPPALGLAHSRRSTEARALFQGFPVRADYVHGIHTVKINMNSSGPGLRGSQGEAGSPACVCSGQEQKFPCEVAPTPASLLEPAGMGGRAGGGGPAKSSPRAQLPVKTQSPSPAQAHPNTHPHPPGVAQVGEGPLNSGALGAES